MPRGGSKRKGKRHSPKRLLWKRKAGITSGGRRKRKKSTK